MGILNRVSNTYKTGVVSHLNTQPYTSILKIFGFGQRKNPLELKMKFVVALMMMTMMVYCSTTMAEDGPEYPDENSDYDGNPFPQDDEDRAGFLCRHCRYLKDGRFNGPYGCHTEGCQKCIEDGEPTANCQGLKCQYCGTEKKTQNKKFKCTSRFCRRCGQHHPGVDC